MKAGKSIPIVDPSGRFERMNSDNGTSFEFHRARFNGYDRATGQTISWVEMNMRQLPGGANEFNEIVQRLDRLKYVSYKNITQLIDFWIDRPNNNSGKDASLVAIMEYAEISSIADIKRSNNDIRIQACRKWFSGVLAALDFLSSLSPPMPHGRINIDSIYIKMSSGNVKLRAPLPFGHEVRQFMLDYWTPPEALLGVYDTVSDIWCLGIAALETLTGKVPYADECDTPEKLFEALIAHRIPKCLELVTDPAAKDFISRCLVDHDRRPMPADLVGHPFVNLGAQLLEKPKSNEECEVIFTSKKMVVNPNAINFALSHRRVSCTEQNAVKNIAAQAKEKGLDLALILDTSCP